MSNTTPSVNILALHEGIKSGLREAFPSSSVPTIDYYVRVGDSIVQPAIFIELNKCPPAQATATGQYSVTLNFAAWVVVSSMDHQAAHIQVRALALAVAAAITGNQWNQPIGAAEIVDVSPSEFLAEPSGAYLAYLVSWTHGAVVGTSVWDADALGSVPSEVKVSAKPDIGTAHESGYKPVTK